MKFSATTALTVLGALVFAVVDTEAHDGVCVPVKSKPVLCQDVGCCNPAHRCQGNGKCCAPGRQQCDMTEDCCGKLVCMDGVCKRPPSPPAGFCSKPDETPDVYASCVDNCGDGEGRNCESVCTEWGIKYVSPNQCHDVGNLKGSIGVGNVYCRREFNRDQDYKNCCQCEEYDPRMH